MDILITASYRLTDDEFVAISRANARHSRLARNFFWGMWAAAIIALAIGAFALSTPGFRWFGAFAAFLGGSLINGLLTARRLARKEFVASPNRNSLVEWRFDPDQLVVTTGASSEKFEWRMVLRVVRTPDGLLIYINDQTFYWLPFHAFASEADKEAFAQLARSKVQNYVVAAR
jgi:hypothetical protein